MCIRKTKGIKWKRKNLATEEKKNKENIALKPAAVEMSTHTSKHNVVIHIYIKYTTLIQTDVTLKASAKIK